MKKGIMTGLIMTTLLLAFTEMGMGDLTGWYAHFAVATTPPPLIYITAPQVLARRMGRPHGRG
jgi:hypothetical protein